LSSDFFEVPAQERNGEYQDEDEPSHNILLASAIVASAVANRDGENRPGSTAEVANAFLGAQTYLGLVFCAVSLGRGVWVLDRFDQDAIAYFRQVVETLCVIS
jgi:hypothetical protein